MTPIQLQDTIKADFNLRVNVFTNLEYAKNWGTYPRIFTSNGFYINSTSGKTTKALRNLGFQELDF